MVDIRDPEIKYTQIFINNEFVDSVSEKTFQTINPSTGRVICEVQEGDKTDVDKAVVAARDAFKRGSVWRTIDASERGRFLYRFADLIDRDKEYIARLETLDIGMVYMESLLVVDIAAKMVRYFAGFADKIEGKTIPSDGPYMTLTRKEPIGVCALITSFNGPFCFASAKVAMALAAGNTVVIKPAEQTPLTTLYMASLTKEVGLPPGVINVVPGLGPTAGAALAEHMDVRMVSFTGSVSVGKLVQSMAGKSNLKRVALELGGKSPLVVFADADIETAVMTAHLSIFNNAGQTCNAPSRLYVEESIYDQFVQKSIELAHRRSVGDPFAPETQQGPQIDEKQFKIVLDYIESGKKEGSRLLAGGSRIAGPGYYIQPTVFSDVTEDMSIAKDEIFGPVQSIYRFRTLDEVIDLCNNTDFGLAAGVFTKDIDKAMQFAQAVHAGTVSINGYNPFCPQLPFGGFKESGLGREFGAEGLNEFLELKSIAIKIDSKSS